MNHPIRPTVWTLGLALLLCVLALPASAGYDDPPPGPNPQHCAYICTSGTACNASCRGNGGAWTTCGQFAGNPANDLDGDGVANNVDNCTCVANANQANCDGDSLGNACDNTDNSWYKQSASVATCHADIDNHFFYETVEMYNKEIWRSACTSATCVKNKLSYSFNCYPDVTNSCCQQKALFRPDCSLPFNYDACGTPKCNF